MIYRAIAQVQFVCDQVSDNTLNTKAKDIFISEEFERSEPTQVLPADTHANFEDIVSLGYDMFSCSPLASYFDEMEKNNSIVGETYCPK